MVFRRALRPGNRPTGYAIIDVAEGNYCVLTQAAFSLNLGSLGEDIDDASIPILWDIENDTMSVIQAGRIRW